MVTQKRPLEKNLQRKIIKSIESSFKGKVIVYKVEKASIDGVPDLFFAIEGIGARFMEVKRDENEEPRANQVFCINKLIQCGVPTYVVKTWEQWLVIRNGFIDVINQQLLE